MPSTQLFQEDFSDIIDVSEVLEAGVYDDPTTGIQMDNTPEAMEHGLFMERLQSFMQSQTDAVMAFALREGKPYEVVRRHVALAHSKILFDQPLVEEGATGATDHGTVNLSLVPTVRSVVVRICSALDILYNLCQFESLLLVTSGNDQDKSFVGGSKLGKAFWDSMKAGGKNGVKAFKKHAKQRGVAEDAGTSTGRKVKNSLKIELNTAMRVALRNASGNTSAEMRWARPEQLEGWGVRLAGWPQDIPFRNPSDNTVRTSISLSVSYANI
ncbi:hypothetical protein BKA62DRAFT_350278 [Auriculariales sp. MPI-PUGE-AT-0066]|nr:hypothetical protein BKA62DRAFT_350278 [Auriculariales sp. MPI-PUGE-AT-0066]